MSALQPVALPEGLEVDGDELGLAGEGALHLLGHQLIGDHGQELGEVAQGHDVGGLGVAQLLGDIVEGNLLLIWVPSVPNRRACFRALLYNSTV